MKLIVGLGNPGQKHERNRHNVGFLAVDRIADEYGFTPFRKRFRGLVSEGRIGSERALILKPQTYMNESGQSVGEAARFLKIPEEDVVVFYDEIDLAPGKLKAKAGGGNAGHNGLRSISSHLGNDYIRVRIGVGHPGRKDLVSGYVLHDFAKADYDWLDPLLTSMTKAAPPLVEGDFARFTAEVARDLGALEETLPRAAGKTQPTKTPRAKSAAGHPAGERIAKAKNALAENLKKWMAKRDKSEGA